MPVATVSAVPAPATETPTALSARVPAQPDAPRAVAIEARVPDAEDTKVPATLEARSYYAGGIDMNQACRWQYTSIFWAELPDWPFSNAYSWKCTNNLVYYWSIDVGAYCRRVYGGDAWADQQGGGTNDWGCFKP
ncbi:hypothetical protein B0H67DRAFT_554608 [Lasiosphaeris hirsuta]|uniref:Uncharacterized protein n=1 Tax=Lasiosphaeris hirsuta TaxID=260670 RepID=A0AA40DWL0_9PEZI|nr:hypothetical protein B0H67DRAFT_554608 [Lasiosphaeris hirsuta]